MLNIFAISCFNSPYIIFLLYFGAILYDTYNSMMYVINYYYPFGYLPLIYLLGGEPFILYQIWGFLHKAKAISPTHIAGGLFVLLREQGLALTKKPASGKARNRQYYFI